VYKMYMERLWFGKPDTKSEFNKSVGQRSRNLVSRDHEPNIALLRIFHLLFFTLSLKSMTCVIDSTTLLERTGS
jgi:hypothetical protein